MCDTPQFTHVIVVVVPSVSQNQILPSSVLHMVQSIGMWVGFSIGFSVKDAKSVVQIVKQSANDKKMILKFLFIIADFKKIDNSCIFYPKVYNFVDITKVRVCKVLFVIHLEHSPPSQRTFKQGLALQVKLFANYNAITAMRQELKSSVNCKIPGIAILRSVNFLPYLLKWLRKPVGKRK